jgi:SET domain-containing protein
LSSFVFNMPRNQSTFAVKRTKTGLGLHALLVIPVNRRIIEYSGPILSADDAEELGGKYLFGLDDNRVIDGSSRSNLARYINHSCRPNAEERLTRNRIWIWSIREIQAGEEITIDYGEEYFDAYIRQKGCKCESCSSQPRKKQTPLD